MLLLILLVAVWPFLSRSDLPPATDAELHIFRLAELSYLIRGGEFYPRWAPNFYFGYGYPIFNYYAPLSYYLGLTVELLPGLDAVDGVKAAFVLGIVAGAVGVYGLVRGGWGESAGLVSAAAFAYAPYIQYVDPHARGDLAELVSLGLFPLAFWALDAYRRHGRPVAWILAVLLVAAVILSHNLIAMVAFAVYLGWWVWIARPGSELAFGRGRSLMAALLLAVGMSAFFWLPIALERNAVNLGTLVGAGAADHFDFRNHFLSLGELLAPSRWLDWGATEPDFALNLGPAQWLLGAVGLVITLAGRARASSYGRFFALLVLTLVFLQLPWSRWVWESVPLLPFLQFPWRLLGPAAVALAVLAGVAVATWQPRLGQAGWLLPGGLIAIIIGQALPLSQVPPWPPEFGPTDARALQAIERRGRWLGTTATADFVPATVAVIPGPTGQLIAAYEGGLPVDRVNRATLPAGASVRSEAIRPLHTRYRVDTPEPTLLRLYQFAFPGWEARLDGEPVAYELGLPEGFIVIPVPAGQHTVDLIFRDTPARRLSWLLSAVSLLLFAVSAGWLWRRQLRRPIVVLQGRESPMAAAFGRRVTIMVAAVAVGLWLALVLWLEPAGWLHYSSSGLVARPATEDVLVDFGGQIWLIGLDPPRQPLQAGTALPVTLYWKAQQSLSIDYQVFVHLLGADGRPVAQSDRLNPGDFPTRRWPLDRYVRDEHRLPIPADLPPGRYELRAGLWVRSDGWRLPVWDESRQPAGDSYLLTPVEVAR